MIQFKLLIKQEQLKQETCLPENAHKLNMPASALELQLKAAPIASILSAILFVCMVYKTNTFGQRPITFKWVCAGFAIGFVLLFVHELLHGIVYPKEANVTIGILVKQLSFVALVEYPLKRNRFVLMSLLPFVLGAVPLMIFTFNQSSSLILNSICFGMAIMGMVSPYPDVYNVWIALKNAGKNDELMFSGDDLYVIKH